MRKCDILTVIIASDLNVHKVESFVELLKRFKRDIRWTIADIIEIPPAICSHKIQLMRDHKQSIEQQKRLNPSMLEVVKEKNYEVIISRVLSNRNAWTEKDLFVCPSWIRCWIDMQESGGTIL